MKLSFPITSVHILEGGGGQLIQGDIPFPPAVWHTASPGVTGVSTAYYTVPSTILL